MKRFLVIFLVLILTFSSVVVCASASEVGSSDPLIQLLDFTTVFNTGSNSSSASGDAGTVKGYNFDLPSTGAVSYVDVVFVCSKTPTSVKAFQDSLTIINIHDDTYRAYGVVESASIYSKRVSLNITYAESGSGTIDFLSLKIAFGSDTFIQGYCGSTMNLIVLSDYSEFDNIITNLAVEPDTLGYLTTNGYLGTNDQSDDFYSNRGYLNISINDYQAYDYFDINLYLTVESIKSVTCVLDDATIPFTISYLDSSSSFEDFYDYGDGTYNEELRNSFFINLHLDLSNFKKSNVLPNIKISFELDSADRNEFYLYSIIGYADVDQLTALDALWFKIRDLFNGLLGIDSSSSDAAEDFDQTAESQASELDEMVSVMGSVEQPDISNVNLDLTSGIDSNILTATTSGFSTVLSNEILIRVLIMALTLGLVGFILYGKKG